MLVATTIIHAWVASVQVDLNHSGRLRAWCSTCRGRHFLVIGLGVLLTAACLLLDILLWAWVYYHVGAIQGREESLFFSGITFTTVGYGDIALNQCLRLLTVCQAINGVLMAGWSTAQLFSGPWLYSFSLNATNKMAISPLKPPAVKKVN